MNWNVNYLYKRSGLLTDYFILSMFWVGGGLVRTPRNPPPPSYGPADIPLSFLLEVAFIDKTYVYPNALRYLRTNLSLNADVSENKLPFVSQSINNFSDCDISQSHDWKCPSLSPHVLLTYIYFCSFNKTSPIFQ